MFIKEMFTRGHIGLKTKKGKKKIWETTKEISDNIKKRIGK